MQQMRVGWNYIWRYGLAALIGAATAALIGVGIYLNSVPLLISGVSGCVFLAFYCLVVLIPWMARWTQSLPLHS
jgi:hypothetical protein